MRLLPIVGHAVMIGIRTRRRGARGKVGPWSISADAAGAVILADGFDDALIDQIARGFGSADSAQHFFQKRRNGILGNLGSWIGGPGGVLRFIDKVRGSVVFEFVKIPGVHAVPGPIVVATAGTPRTPIAR